MKYLLQLALFLLCCGCASNQPVESLIEPSNSGTGHIGCLVDGKVWNSTGTLNPGMYSVANLDHIDTSSGRRLLVIVGYREQFVQPETEQAIFMYCPIKEETGIYRLDSASFADRISNKLYAAPKGVYELVVTTLDTARSIVAGTFAFRAGNAHGDSVSVTEGRFDFRYR